MIEKKLSIITADGTSHSLLFQPAESGNWPGVIHLTDIGGNRPAHIDMAKRLANEGYTVLLPNVFFRSGEPPMLEFPIRRDDPAVMKRLQELLASMTTADMAKDARHYAEFLQAQAGVSPGHLSIVGYCYTGQMALLGAAAAPEQIGAAASFHGGGLYTDKPDSPHTYINRIKARLHVGHAKDDSSMPAEAIAKFNTALAEWGGQYEAKTYDAMHGWCVPDNPSYNKAEAEKAYSALLALLKKSAGQ
ncbi:MAG: dienelactone hydrolase family protein [Micavibrio sp.]|nr:dienelactone hydrolase family protein [Micavibrio sp.]